MELTRMTRVSNPTDNEPEQTCTMIDKGTYRPKHELYRLQCSECGVMFWQTHGHLPNVRNCPCCGAKVMRVAALDELEHESSSGYYEVNITGEGNGWAEIMCSAFDDFFADANESCDAKQMERLVRYIHESINSLPVSNLPADDVVELMRNHSLYEISTLLSPNNFTTNVLEQLADMVERDYVRRDSLNTMVNTLNCTNNELEELKDERDRLKSLCGQYETEMHELRKQHKVECNNLKQELAAYKDAYETTDRILRNLEEDISHRGKQEKYSMTYDASINHVTDVASETTERVTRNEHESLLTECAKLKAEIEQWEGLLANIELPEYPMTEFRPREDDLRENPASIKAQDSELHVAEPAETTEADTTKSETSEFDDSRESLEADVKGYSNWPCSADEILGLLDRQKAITEKDMIVSVDTIFGWLDRQKAITEKDMLDEMMHVYIPSADDITKRDKRIAELESERDELKEKTRRINESDARWEKTIRELELMIELIASDRDCLQELYEQQNTTIEKLQAERDELKAELEKRTEQVDGTATLEAINALWRDLSYSHNKLRTYDRLKRHCDSQSKELTKLQVAHIRDKEEIARLEKQADRLMEQVDHGREWIERGMQYRQLLESIGAWHNTNFGECCNPCPYIEECESAENNYCIFQSRTLERIKELGIEVD